METFPASDAIAVSSAAVRPYRGNDDGP